MAPSFSNAKLLSSFVVNAISKRGFSSAAAPQVVKAGSAAARTGGGVKKTGEEIARSTEKVAWVPDPRTGFYRPENVAEEIDVAELRTALLKKR